MVDTLPGVALDGAVDGRLQGLEFGQVNICQGVGRGVASGVSHSVQVE